MGWGSASDLFNKYKVPKHTYSTPSTTTTLQPPTATAPTEGTSTIGGTILNAITSSVNDLITAATTSSSTNVTAATVASTDQDVLKIFPEETVNSTRTIVETSTVALQETLQTNATTILNDIQTNATNAITFLMETTTEFVANVVSTSPTTYWQWNATSGYTPNNASTSSDIVGRDNDLLNNDHNNHHHQHEGTHMQYLSLTILIGAILLMLCMICFVLNVFYWVFRKRNSFHARYNLRNKSACDVELVATV